MGNTKYSNKEHILNILAKDYPGYVEVTEEKMKLLHSNNPEIINRMFAGLHDGDLVFVAYILEPHTFGAIKGMCCNGIRFGKDGDYISLPLLPERVFTRLD